MPPRERFGVAFCYPRARSLDRAPTASFNNRSIQIMRFVLGGILLGCLTLAACANQTPAQQAATLACVEDEAGAILSIVSTDASGIPTTTTTVIGGVTGVLKTAASDPNCAAAIAGAASAASASVKAR
jgi:hypothetical protein